MLRKYPYFKIQAHIINGRDLLAMDRGGVSDPYIKCIHGQGSKLFQSKPVAKTVNPTWDETFIVHVDNPFKPLTFQVFDILTKFHGRCYTIEPKFTVKNIPFEMLFSIQPNSSLDEDYPRKYFVYLTSKDDWHGIENV